MERYIKNVKQKCNIEMYNIQKKDDQKNKNLVVFLIARKEIIMKKLDQIRQESKEIKDKIDDTEERLRQLKNQEKKILKQDIIKRRKERTHRLITRGAILESLIENAEELTDEEIKILLEEAIKTKEFKETLRIMRVNQGQYNN